MAAGSPHEIGGKRQEADNMKQMRAAAGAAVLLAGSLISITGAGAQLGSVTLQVDANADRHPIDPRIYGTAYATPAQLADLNAPLNRYGGNNASRYNWQINADNRGFDWYFESVPESSATPGERGDRIIRDTRAGGAEPLITIPALGWAAKLGPNRSKLASFSIAKYGPQTGRDWEWFPDAGNGISSTTGKPITGNDPNDANVPVNEAFQQGWVQHLVNTWGSAQNGGLKYYVLDNEPSIWHSTHRDVHPTGATMDEIRDKLIAHARMIKNIDPTATTMGPEEWGWSGYLFSGYDLQWGDQNGWSDWSRLPDRKAHGGQDFLPWLLGQFKQEHQRTGQRLLDIFTVHYYPQGGEYSDHVDTDLQLRRNRSTRSLWDPNYTDETWIHDKVRLIPRLKQWVKDYYPETPIGLTEYNWGAENHINGATAQADVYGIFGREGLDMGCRWTTPPTASPTYKAMKLYRNYDGQKRGFGDVSVRAVAPNPDNVSAFAALRSSDGAMTVMVINKQLSASQPITLNVANFPEAVRAEPWQLTAANQIRRLADVAVTNGVLTTTLPAQSITLFVLPKGGTTPPPPPPGDPMFASSLAAQPTSLVIGQSSTLSATVTCTNGSLNNGVVDLSIYNSAGTRVGQKLWEGESLSLFEEKSYSHAWTPPAVGSYTVTLRVSGTGGTPQYHTNSGGATVTVTEAPTAQPVFTTSASGQPASVAPGGTSTLTAIVNCAQGSLSNGLIDVEVYNSNGTKVGQKFWSGESFATGQQKSYTFPWTAPAAPGTYTLKVGVFGTDWNPMHHWNWDAGTITVTGTPAPEPVFVTSATASPATLAGGATSTITARVKPTTGSLTNGIVDVEVYNEGGVKVGQQIWNAQTLSTNQEGVYPYVWTAPTAGGTYTVKIGVFAEGWARQLVWNNNAATLQVTQTSPDPVFSSSASASPATIAAGGTTTITAIVTPTSGTLNAGIVDIEVYNSSGGKVGQKVWDSVSLATNQAGTYTYAWTAPNVGGSYIVKVGVFSTGWAKQLHWNNAAATVGVTATTVDPTFTTSASASPATVAPGQTTNVTAVVACTTGGLNNGVIDIEIYDAAGTKVGQKFWPTESIPAGQQKSYTYAWTAPATPGVYTLKVGMFGTNWNPLYTWNWDAGKVTVSAATAAPALVSGLRGEYFANQTLSGSPTLARTDATVNFSWSGVPATGLPKDGFSARWTGQLKATTTGAHTFYTSSDEGIRLWVNGQLVIDHWTAHTLAEKASAAIQLTAGQLYDVRVEYYDKTGTAAAKLSWKAPGGAKQVIPSSQLFSTAP